MVRKKVEDNALEWIVSGKTMAERVQEAHDAGEMASKVFDDPETMPKIIEAIDSEKKVDFAKACKAAGITDVDMINRMWDATMGSLDPQVAKPCW